MLDQRVTHKLLVTHDLEWVKIFTKKFYSFDDKLNGLDEVMVFKNKKRILLLNDGSSYENWGIKACFDGIKEIFSDEEILGVSHSYMHKKYNLEPKILGRSLFSKESRVAKKFFKPFHLLPRIVDEYEYIALKWLSGDGGEGAADFIKKLDDVDVVIFNAEGSTYRDNIGAIKGLFMLWFSKTKFNKSAYFINGSVTLTDVDAILPAMINKVFSTIDGVTVREPMSKLSVTKYYPKLKGVTVVPDSVFSLPRKNKVEAEILNLIQGDFFCFSLSMLPMDYIVTKNKSSLVELIIKLKKRFGTPVLLAKDVEDQVLKDLARETDAVFLGADYTYLQVMEVLEKSKFLLSGRYHHLIFASKVGCPFIALNTSSHKITGLCMLFHELAGKPYDPTDLWSTVDDIIEDALQICANPDLRTLIRARAEDLKLNSYGHKLFK